MIHPHAVIWEWNDAVTFLSSHWLLHANLSFDGVLELLELISMLCLHFCYHLLIGFQNEMSDRLAWAITFLYTLRFSTVCVNTPADTFLAMSKGSQVPSFAVCLFSSARHLSSSHYVPASSFSLLIKWLTKNGTWYLVLICLPSKFLSKHLDYSSYCPMYF